MKKVLATFSMVALLLTLSTSVFAELKTWKSLLTTQITEINVTQLADRMQQKKKFVLLDIREPAEFEAGHIKGAKNVPRGLIDFKLPRMVKNANTPIIIYCKSGARGALATQTLNQLGYKNVTNVKGAFMAWVKAGNEYYNMFGSSKAVKWGAKEKMKKK